MDEQKKEKKQNKSEKVTWVTSIEEDALEDYLFELPQEAVISE